MKKSTPSLQKLIHDQAHPIWDSLHVYGSLIEKMGDAEIVLLGEAYGTRESYLTRAYLTQRLIEEKGFSAVVIEGDASEALTVHEYVQGMPKKKSPKDALDGFMRFPSWRWRNEEVAHFVHWLRAYNDNQEAETGKVGFYGLDFQSHSPGNDIAAWNDVWNLREMERFETLEHILNHHRINGTSKIIVWAHNAHVGDARATDMLSKGQCNLGQLVKEKFPRTSYSLGFTTYQGTVTVASERNDALEQKTVRPALKGSYESLFHETGLPSFFLTFDGKESFWNELNEPRDERMIDAFTGGEHRKHYLHARLVDQFDAVIHLDNTKGVTPLGQRNDPISDNSVGNVTMNTEPFPN